jgi:hypothetical protein
MYTKSAECMGESERGNLYNKLMFQCMRNIQKKKGYLAFS